MINLTKHIISSKFYKNKNYKKYTSNLQNINFNWVTSIFLILISVNFI